MVGYAKSLARRCWVNHPGCPPDGGTWSDVEPSDPVGCRGLQVWQGRGRTAGNVRETDAKTEPRSGSAAGFTEVSTARWKRAFAFVFEIASGVAPTYTCHGSASSCASAAQEKFPPRCDPLCSDIGYPHLPTPMIAQIDELDVCTRQQAKFPTPPWYLIDLVKHFSDMKRFSCISRSCVCLLHSTVRQNRSCDIP